MVGFENIVKSLTSWLSKLKSASEFRTTNLKTLHLVRPNETDQPDPSHPELGPWGPNPTQNRVQIGLIWVY